MPDIKLAVRWERYTPDLPGNRASDRPFYFELAADMTKLQFAAMQTDLQAADDFPTPPKDETEEAALARVAEERAESIRRVAKVLTPYVRFGTEPISFGGEPCTTLERYLEVVATLQSREYFREVSAALARANMVSDVEVFSERLSGGFTSTRAPRSA